MKRGFYYWLAFGIVFFFLALTISAGLAQFPDPKDEAKLYELAKKEGTLVLYGSSPLEANQSIAKDFETKYPGIKVEILRIVGVRQYQRFLHETNAKQYIADFLQISDQPSMKALVQLGHIVDWRVPTSDRIPSPFRIGNYSYSPAVLDIVIAYNFNKVTPEEVKILGSSWKGVLNSRFKGRFTTTKHKYGAGYAGVHMFMDPKYAKVYGPEFIKAVAAQKPNIYSDSLVALDRVIAGEHDFAYWTWESVAYLKWMQGAPIRWVHPDPTPVWGNNWHAVSKYAPHPNAARLFLNWITGEEGALACQRTGYKTVLEGVKDTRKAASEPWYDPIKTRYDVDFDRWEKNYHAEMDFWEKTITEGR